MEYYGGAPVRQLSQWQLFVKQNSDLLRGKGRTKEEFGNAMRRISKMYREQHNVKPARVYVRSPCAANKDTRRNQQNCTTTDGCTWKKASVDKYGSKRVAHCSKKLTYAK